MPKKSFTLIELLVVIIIIGILAAIALPNFGPMKEQVLDREAQSNLKLILAAERIWRMESSNNQYIACNNIAEINTNLKLSIPSSNPNWNYSVQICVAGVTFCAQATRNGSDGRSWHIYSPTTAIPDPQPESGPCLVP